jgi:uncharacterized protein YndB with AHSA1/START domain
MNTRHILLTASAVIMAAAASGTAASDGQTHALSVTRAFDVPVERLWAAWSVSEDVMKWWAPAPYTTPVAEMDFREGGASVICMRPPEGTDICTTWTYERLVPHREIEFVLGWSDAEGNPADPVSMGLPPDIPEAVRHLITFTDLGNGRSEMTVNEYGYASAATVAMSKAGLEQSLDQLAVAVAAE